MKQLVHHSTHAVATASYGIIPLSPERVGIFELLSPTRRQVLASHHSKRSVSSTEVMSASAISPLYVLCFLPSDHPEVNVMLRSSDLPSTHSRMYKSFLGMRPPFFQTLVGLPQLPGTEEENGDEETSDARWPTCRTSPQSERARH